MVRNFGTRLGVSQKKLQKNRTVAQKGIKEEQQIKMIKGFIPSDKDPGYDEPRRKSKLQIISDIEP